jgi:ATP-binding cassette subfamily B protein
MTKLLRRFLRPYRGSLAIVMVLVTIQALANLYLPNLNADIINNGVLKGDTGYIVRTGVSMLLSRACSGSARSWGSTSARGLPWLSGATFGARSSARS